MFRNIITALATVFKRREPKPAAGGLLKHIQETAAIQTALAVSRTVRPKPVSAKLSAHRRWRKTRKRIERDSRRINRRDT